MTPFGESEFQQVAAGGAAEILRCRGGRGAARDAAKLGGSGQLDCLRSGSTIIKAFHRRDAEDAEFFGGFLHSSFELGYHKNLDHRGHGGHGGNLSHSSAASANSAVQCLISNTHPFRSS